MRARVLCVVCGWRRVGGVRLGGEAVVVEDAGEAGVVK